jgi:hypothetical protein
VGARFSAPVQTGPGVHLAFCTIGTGSFPVVKSDPGMTLTPHPLLMPWSRKGRAIPLLPLWVVRPVQSLSVCTRVHFTLPTIAQLFHKLPHSISVDFDAELFCRHLLSFTYFFNQMAAFVFSYFSLRPNRQLQKHQAKVTEKECSHLV